MIGVYEAALVPEGYRPDWEMTEEAWRFERLCVAICAVWWGWSFHDIVRYYSTKSRPMVMLRRADDRQRRS